MSEILRNKEGNPYVSLKEEPLNFNSGSNPGVLANGKPYNRISTFASDIGDKKQLINWSNTNIIKGLASFPDLHAKANSLIHTRGTKQEYKELIELINIRVGANEAAIFGTEFHRMTEYVEKTLASGKGVATPILEDTAISNYLSAIKAYPLEFIDSEVFVVNDELQLAGSLDRLYRLPNGEVVVADVKTGNMVNKFPLSTIVQVAIYANSSRYNQETGKRESLHKDLNPKKGLLLHSPLNVQETFIYELNLELGYKLAKIHHKEKQISEKILKDFEVTNAKF